VKRSFDIIISVLLVFVTLPVILLVLLLVRLKLGSPVIFVQKRPGLNGKVFNIYKIRTMTDERNSEGFLLADSFRLTGFGKVLRSSSLDELPSLWNVLKGDLSLIGPRPLLVEYLPLYSLDQARRHQVRPGITGWAQVNGRNLISWKEKFDLDLWYIDNYSPWLDLKILWMTLKKVIQREGVNQINHVTIGKFRGESKEIE
jgi:sugar transferase EpsL